MTLSGPALPSDVETLQRLLLAREAELEKARADLVQAKAREIGSEAVIAQLRLAIEKMRRALFGQRSERGTRLLDQMELELEELEASASEDAFTAKPSATNPGTEVAAFTRRKPSRRPWPEPLPRERILIPGPTACVCCGSTRLSKLGEDVTETLEVVPRQWKVLQHVREKFSCRACEAISQAPAPFHVLPRGLAGPRLLAMVLFEKYGQHQPLNRQASRPRPGASCPSLPRSRWKRSLAWMRCLLLSGRSPVCRPPRALPCGVSDPPRCCTLWRPGCAPNVAGSHASRGGQDDG